MEKYKRGNDQALPGVAEELVGAKAFFIRAGLFKDVDLVLGCHVDSDLSTSSGQGGNNTGWFRPVQLPRQSAHAAGGALVRTKRAGRGRADEHRVEFPT